MSNWGHVDKEEIIISEEGLDEAIHNAYLKGRNDVLEKISAEIEEQMKMECFDTYDEMFAYRTGLENAIDTIDKYKAESEDEG